MAKSKTKKVAAPKKFFVVVDVDLDNGGCAEICSCTGVHTNLEAAKRDAEEHCKENDFSNSRVGVAEIILVNNTAPIEFIAP